MKTGEARVRIVDETRIPIGLEMPARLETTRMVSPESQISTVASGRRVVGVCVDGVCSVGV